VSEVSPGHLKFKFQRLLKKFFYWPPPDQLYGPPVYINEYFYYFRYQHSKRSIEVPDIWWIKVTGPCCFEICTGRSYQGRCMYAPSGFEGRPESYIRTIKSIIKKRSSSCQSESFFGSTRP
jgi:hypothetical protein